MNNRIGVVGIVVTNRSKVIGRLNAILSDYADIIVGRMGLPYREKNIFVISLIVDGNTDAIGALTGKLGSLDEVVVKTALTPERD